MHATINGVVEEVKRVNYFKRDCLMVSIKETAVRNIRRSRVIPRIGRGFLEEEIERVLYLSGVTALDREGIPTRYRSSIIQPQDVQSLIVHGIGSEPYNISPEISLGGKTP